LSDILERVGYPKVNATTLKLLLEELESDSKRFAQEIIATIDSGKMTFWDWIKLALYFYRVRPTIVYVKTHRKQALEVSRRILRILVYEE